MRKSLLFLGLFAFLFLISCRHSRPEGVIPADRMEGVLYDYHRVLAMARATQDDDSLAWRMRSILMSLYAKHDITAEEFDRSMAYYQRKPKELKEIYEKISEREVERLGKPRDGEQERLTNATGDTVNLWRGGNFYMLNSQGERRMYFKIPIDTAVRSNDRLEWRFNTQWLYHQGEHSATAVLVCRYEGGKGDSVVATSNYITGMGLNVLTVRVAERKLKSVEGYVLQNTMRTERPRLLVLNDFLFLRMRDRLLPVETEEMETLPVDTLVEKKAEKPTISGSRNIRDSLLRDEKQDGNRTHFR